MVMYKIDRRGGVGGVQKSYTRTDPAAAMTDLNKYIFKVRSGLHTFWAES